MNRLAGCEVMDLHGLIANDVVTGVPTLLPTNRHNVSITRVENGFYVIVGCKTFVSTSWEEVAEGLGLYFRNPAKAFVKFLNEEKV